MNKAVKVKILENWYAIDSILFNKHARDVIKEGATFREYVSLKGALLSNLFEFYAHIQYSPVYKDLPTSVKSLTESSKQSARYAKTLAANILKNKGVQEALKKRIIRESQQQEIKNVDAYANKVVSEKFTQLSLDNVLVGVPILEARCISCTEDFKGQILEDAYKMMRNSLIDLSKKCIKTS
jgi:hypothetical protein